MAEHIPPFAALRAFEVVMRVGSVTKACSELSVTPAAISQQLRILEEHMGVALLDRSGGRLQATPEGTALGAALTIGFQQIREAVSSVRGRAEELPLRISTTPSFAANWLMHRLRSFCEKHPNIEIIIATNSELVDLDAGKFDAVIRFGAAPPSDVESLPLLMTGLSVVGARSLVGTAPLTDPSELFRFPWLMEPGKDIFSAWLRSYGLEPEKHRSIITVEGGMHYSALLAGQGIALMGRELARSDTEAGRLQVLFENIDPRENTGYRLLWLSRHERPTLRLFIRWLSSQRETATER